MSKEILYTIVTYKEKYYHCSSYKSLIGSFKCSKFLNSNEKLYVFVADNTDLNEWDCEVAENLDHISVYYHRFKNNPGLSFAYNKAVDFAKKSGFSWVVLLDQDTMLPSNFYEGYSQSIRQNETIFLKVPVVFINFNAILSPSKYIGYRAYLYKIVEPGIKKLKGNSFINTGMLINIDFYIKVGGYNEQIKLDFADHDFVYRCTRFTTQYEVLNVKLLQDFSSFTNSKEQAINRYRLYLRDLKTFKKGKTNKYMLFFNSDFLRLVKLSIQYKSFDFLKLRLSK